MALAQRISSALLGLAVAAVAVGGEVTWVEVDGQRYGAEPDSLGPIGGGPGYGRIVTKGDFVVRTLDELLEALSRAKAGQTVFIPGSVEIDLTARIYIEQLVLEVPGGVTLASDRGHEGSPGALLLSDTLRTPLMIRATGPDVRVTGLRIQGPNPKRYIEHHRRAFREGAGGHAYYYKFPIQKGIVGAHDRLEVDNCDISGFGHAGVRLGGGQGHHIHHNFIHHCQHQGLGYGVSHNKARSLIERNLFDFNRHSIAGTGRPGTSYEARHNVELGTSLSHCFDMHGGRDRKDGTNVAGTTILIHHNTFRAPTTPVVIRGVPEERCEVHRNWFPRHPTPQSAVRAEEKTRVYDNAYGTDPPRVIP
ncbi:MAG TPA: hypothetical protein EYH34_15770 [Planctomycetes bacterium]|nr:hypothetical protein [Planctomycetota bacterium]